VRAFPCASGCASEPPIALQRRHCKGRSDYHQPVHHQPLCVRACVRCVFVRACACVLKLLANYREIIVHPEYEVHHRFDDIIWIEEKATPTRPTTHQHHKRRKGRLATIDTFDYSIVLLKSYVQAAYTCRFERYRANGKPSTASKGVSQRRLASVVEHSQACQ
jgi:hypothetical protein